MAGSTAPWASTMNYHSLASVMSQQPDLAILRRFLPLHVRDLLRLQAEIASSNRDLEFIIAQDRESGDPEKKEFEFCFASVKGPPHPTREKGLQWEKLDELGQKLSSYRTALLQYKQLCELPSVNQMELGNLREVLDSNGGYHGFPRGLENAIWSKGNEADLTSLTGRYEKLDILSRWIDSTLLRLYHNIIGHRLHGPVYLAGSSMQLPITHYSDHVVAVAVNAISTVLSSLLPTMLIFTLSFVQSPLAQAAAIVVSTSLFSVVLRVMTNIGRNQSFLATAAFATITSFLLFSGYCR